MYQDDNGLFDGPPDHQHTFLDSAAWAFTGYVVGSKLDNTRFGRWFNTSKVVGFIGRMILGLCVFLAGVYVYVLIKVW